MGEPPVLVAYVYPMAVGVTRGIRSAFLRTAEESADADVADNDDAGDAHTVEQGDGEAPRVHRWTIVRRAAVTVWAVALGLFCVFVGVPFDRAGLVLWALLGLLAASIGRGRAGQAVIDIVPFGVVLVGYDFLRGLASRIGLPTHWNPQLDLDRDMFGGHVPTVVIQEYLKYPTVQWWELLVSLVYVSYFLLFIVTAAALWLRSRRDFYRWTCRFVPLCLVAFTCFALFPAAPPWAAARCTSTDVAAHPAAPRCLSTSPASAGGGLIGKFSHPRPGTYPYVQRLSGRGLQYLHITRADSVLHNGQRISDLVAAVPSMHSAGVLLFVLFMWNRVRARFRPLLVLYPLAMTFTLLYSGEHYVTDILAGWVAATLVHTSSSLVERQRRARRRHQAEDRGCAGSRGPGDPVGKAPRPTPNRIQPSRPRDSLTR